MDDATQEGGGGSASEKNPAQTPPHKIQFSYIKSSSFRVSHADGVIGALTPRLDINMNFWNERFPIPKRVMFKVNPDGTLGGELTDEREVRPGVVREVEVGVVMDLDVARSFRAWLGDRIAEAERILAEKGQQ